MPESEYPFDTPEMWIRAGFDALAAHIAILDAQGTIVAVNAAGALGRAGERPQIIAFDGAELTGDHTHVVGDIRRLGTWDHRISSLIMLSGTWECCDDDEFTGTNMAT